jgi:hypothetical protein
MNRLEREERDPKRGQKKNASFGLWEPEEPTVAPLALLSLPLGRLHSQKSRQRRRETRATESSPGAQASAPRAAR